MYLLGQNMWESKSVISDIHITFALYLIVDISKDNRCIFQIQFSQWVINGGIGSNLMLAFVIIFVQDTKIIISKHIAQLFLMLH
jgi:hypothetical protein